MMSTNSVVAILAGLVALGLATLHFLLLMFTPQPSRTHHSEKQYTTTPSSQPLALSKLSDDASLRLSVIVPAYNEEARLGVMIDEAMGYFFASEIDRLPNDPSATGTGTGTGTGAEKLSEKTKDSVSKRREGRVEIIVVDDGSTDRTSQVARELSEKWGKKARELSNGQDGEPEIRVVGLKKNRGKGGAVQHLILFADADGASRFEDLDLLLRAMDRIQDKDGQGIVVGSRAHLVSSEAVVKRSFLRNFLMHGFHLFLRTLGVRGIRDTQCGFKLFTRPTASLLFPQLHLPRWSFDVELLLLASMFKPPIPVAEIPIAWHEVNGSKIRLGWDSIGMARDLLVLRGNLAVGRWRVPVRGKNGR